MFYWPVTECSVPVERVELVVMMMLILKALKRFRTVFPNIFYDFFGFDNQNAVNVGGDNKMLYSGDKNSYKIEYFIT